MTSLVTYKTIPELKNHYVFDPMWMTDKKTALIIMKVHKNINLWQDHNFTKGTKAFLVIKDLLSAEFLR